MTSPFATGGGGTHFEARVAADCLAAILCQAPIRGLPGEFATRLRTQRASFGDPLDDLVVNGVHQDGRETDLHLQVKTTLTFTDKNSDWIEVLHRTWDTFERPGFDPAVHRLGVAIATYNARVDQHYQAILAWAAHSTDAAHFMERIGQPDFSHRDKQTFLTITRAILETHCGRALHDDELWRFLKSFVIVHYDFQTGDSSRDRGNVVDRLRGLFDPAERGQANRIWDHLVAKAGELIPTGGGATRATLVEQLSADGFAPGTAPSFRKDVRSLQTESRRALADIKSHIGDLRLHRRRAHQQIREALAAGRFVQIDGEPGSGKSALLKEVAQECERNGPVLVLKDSRIHPKGWAAHAHVLGISDDLPALLREFSCMGEPILFIDGIDKITDPAVQLTVNDLVRAIAGNESLSDWRILATVREQNLHHLETWLDTDALKLLPLRNVRIEPLDDDELRLVTDHFPRLRPLLAQTGPDVILKRPFFLNALVSLPEDDERTQLPATEVELMILWWQMGGADRKEPASAQRRRNLLLQAAEAVAHRPNAPIPVRDLHPDALDELRSAGVFRDNEFGHSVVFAHDIYEEWALCELLFGRQPADVAAFLQQTREPDLLRRPIQLLGAYALETSPTAEAWKALLDASSASSLRPVWQRAVLTASVQSTRTTQLLQKLTPYLLEKDCERLRRLLLAMSTIEVLPNPLFLNQQATPDLQPDERARFANALAVPKPVTWVRFLDWLIPQVPSLPPSLIPDLLPVFKTWQDTYGTRNARHCREIGEFAYAWLKEIEEARHPPKWGDRREPFGGAVSGEDIEKSVRTIFLASARHVPALASEYLRTKGADRKSGHIFRGEILQNCGALVLTLPAELVDFILTAFLDDPQDPRERDPFGSYSAHVFDELGITSHDFYPASPVQPPFLNLLRNHEHQGLRLIRAICNHCIAVWRKAKQRGLRYTQPVTPVPLTLKFPWGHQTFWGDGQVYLWFRGIWGNDAVKSALMALEQWALEKLDNGADFDEIFRKVVEANNSVAALGVAISLCLARPGASLKATFPLVTSPILWQWDIERLTGESSRINQMGNWHRYDFQLSAVAKLNQRPHRNLEIRRLVPYFVLSDDKKLRRKYTAAIRRFPKRPPISYREETNDPEYLAALCERMARYTEQADPMHWKTGPTADGQHIQLWNDAPHLRDEEFKAWQQNHLRHNAYLAVALWADKSLEEGAVNDRLSLDDALAKARAWDAPDLFDKASASFDDRHLAAAVAGTACVAAMYGSAEAWTGNLAVWCLDVLDRAATGPENAQEGFPRSSSLIMHPAVYAAHGYSALIARGYEIRRCQRGLLSLAVDALTDVQRAVFTAAKRYAAGYAEFYWVLLDLLLQQCIVQREDIPDFHSMIWDQPEADRKLALLERAESFLDSVTSPALPTVPMPWIKGEISAPHVRRDTKGYVRNDVIFLYDVAGKLVSEASLDVILSDPGRRASFIHFVISLLELTIQEIVPPFAKSKREYNGNTPYEWVFSFAAWCGRLSVNLSRAEARDLILSRIWAQDTDTALLMMQSLMRSFMVRAFLKPGVISAENLGLWSDMVSWLFKTPEWARNGSGNGRYLNNEFTQCAFSTLFCAVPDFSPMVCGIDPGWPHLHKFLPVIERAICEFGLNATLFHAVTTFLKRGGIDLLPDPALVWLHNVVVARKGQRKFWAANGEDTVDVIKNLIAKKGNVLTSEHHRLIASIADILIDDGVRGAGFLQQELLRLT